MQRVNMVFDDALDDVDIIVVPDETASEIEAIGQAFLQWLPTATDDAYRTVIDGHVCPVAETDGFVKWLNARHCLGAEKAYIEVQHTHYCPQYKTVEF